MTVRAVYKVVGYDRQTEKLAVTFDVPWTQIAQAQSIAGIETRDDMQAGDWELTPQQSLEIAHLIRAPLDLARYDFFLEPYVLDGESLP
ncbi:MAG TPA: hypothetical protein VGG99_07245 [Acetobacteraceae bacterium]|jgi:hypothetical protein